MQIRDRKHSRCIIHLARPVRLRAILRVLSWQWHNVCGRARDMSSHAWVVIACKVWSECVSRLVMPRNGNEIFANCSRASSEIYRWREMNVSVDAFTNCRIIKAWEYACKRGMNARFWKNSLPWKMSNGKIERFEDSKHVEKLWLNYILNFLFFTNFILNQ